MKDAKHFCKIIDVDEKEVCRRGNNSTDRAILMELLYRFCNITQAEIGQMVGKIDYSSVSVARKRLRIKMEKDLALKKQFQNILSKLSRLKI